LICHELFTNYEYFGRRSKRTTKPKITAERRPALHVATLELMAEKR
jgi:hypothetical protein